MSWLSPRVVATLCFCVTLAGPLLFFAGKTACETRLRGAAAAGGLDVLNGTRVLIIGGTGFMGVHTVERLLDAGASVELLGTGHSKNPFEGRAHETICDRHAGCLATLLQQGPWDLVVDFPVFNVQDAKAIFENSQWVRHYIFPSSDDVYMVCDEGRFRYSSTGALLEDSAVRPTNASERDRLNKWDSYGSQKKELEETLTAAGVNFTALRLPDVWGSGESSGRFVTFLRSLEQGRSIGLSVRGRGHESGETFKPGFVFAEDVAQMVHLLWRAGPQQGPVNVAINDGVVFKDVVTATHQMLQELSGPGTVEPLSFSEEKPVPLCSTDIGPLDISRAEALGFVPTPWREGWRATVAALLKASRNSSAATSDLAKCISACDRVCGCE